MSPCGYPTWVNPTARLGADRSDERGLVEAQVGLLVENVYQKGGSYTVTVMC